MSLDLTGRLLASVSPVALFAGGEVGVWYDPSDVANLAWRYNLLTYTEQFDNAVWEKQNSGTGSLPVITTNYGIAPDGTTTAARVQLDKGAGTTSADFSQWSGPTINQIVSVPFVFSVWLKTNDGSTKVVTMTDPIPTANSVTVTGSWQQFSLSAVAGSATNFPRIRLRGNEGTATTADILYWHPQWEAGSTATAYQRISDVNTEVMERFPKATLFQDNAGTTPVTAPAQTVGLMLDKSQGLVLGSELWSDTGVTVETGWSQAGSVYTHTAGIGTINKNIGLVTGKTYQVTFTVTGRTAGNIGPVYGGSVSGPTVTANGTYTQRVASGVNVLMYFQPSVDFVGSVSGISVKLLPGNHATQATSAQRPTYGINPITGTRNLLTYTEQFDNAIWTKANATIVANSAVAPDGTLTADTLVSTTTNTAKYAFQSGLPSTVGTFTVYAKAAGETVVSLWFTGASVGAVFTLTGSGSTTLNGATYSSITAVGDGWYRCQVYYSSATTTAHIYLRNGSGFIGDGTSGILIWGAQVELGSTATAYQKVVTQYEVTEAGVQSVSYLAFDGVDDGMVTGTITPAIDKVQVFAGVRKLSDAAVGVVAEFSTSLSPGSFYVSAPNSVGPSYGWASRGSASATPITATTYTAPITNVLTGLGDISGDTATLRINGVQVGQTTADQGTGNYLAYPLYIGRRGGSTLPLNGRIYSLIVRFGANLTDGQITATEAWVNSKTGAF